MNSTDPADELSWLVEVLQKAEADGEKVICCRLYLKLELSLLSLPTLFLQVLCC